MYQEEKKWFLLENNKIQRILRQLKSKISFLNKTIPLQQNPHQHLSFNPKDPKKTENVDKAMQPQSRLIRPVNVYGRKTHPASNSDVQPPQQFRYSSFRTSNALRDQSSLLEEPENEYSLPQYRSVNSSNIIPNAPNPPGSYTSLFTGSLSEASDRERRQAVQECFRDCIYHLWYQPLMINASLGQENSFHSEEINGLSDYGLKGALQQSSDGSWTFRTETYKSQLAKKQGVVPLSVLASFALGRRPLLLQDLDDADTILKQEYFYEQILPHRRRFVLIEHLTQLSIQEITHRDVIVELLQVCIQLKAYHQARELLEFITIYFFPTSLEQYKFLHFKSREAQCHPKIDFILARQLTPSRCLHPAFTEYLAWCFDYYGITSIRCITRALALILSGFSLHINDFIDVVKIHHFFASGLNTTSNYNTESLSTDDFAITKVTNWIVLLIQATLPEDEHIKNSPFFLSWIDRMYSICGLCVLLRGTISSETYKQQSIETLYIRCWEIIFHSVGKADTVKYIKKTDYIMEWLTSRLSNLNEKPQPELFSSLSSTYGYLGRMISLVKCWMDAGFFNISHQFVTYLLNNYTDLNSPREKKGFQLNESFSMEGLSPTYDEIVALSQEIGSKISGLRWKFDDIFEDWVEKTPPLIDKSSESYQKRYENDRSPLSNKKDLDEIHFSSLNNDISPTSNQKTPSSNQRIKLYDDIQETPTRNIFTNQEAISTIRTKQLWELSRMTDLDLKIRKSPVVETSPVRGPLITISNIQAQSPLCPLASWQFTSKNCHITENTNRKDTISWRLRKKKKVENSFSSSEEDELSLL